MTALDNSSPSSSASPCGNDSTGCENKSGVAWMGAATLDDGLAASKAWNVVLATSRTWLSMPVHSTMGTRELESLQVNANHTYWW